MKITAAVLVELGKVLELAELEVPVLETGQVLVEIAFSAVCQTQVLEARGHRGHDRFLPHCLGHEGSGSVLETGPGVTRVKQGDAITLSWIKGAGADVPRTVYRWGQRQVNAGAVTTLSTHAVVSENRLTLLPEGISMREAAVLGCAVPTGAGAVFNTAGVRPGQSIAIFGVGGIGLSAVMAAVIAGCMPIIAVDIRVSQLELAQRIGATHVIDSRCHDAVGEIGRIVSNGVDFAVEASGCPAVMLQALSSVRRQGGAAIVIGNAYFGQKMGLDPQELNNGKRLLGTWGGDNVPERDFPRYARLLKAGKIDSAILLSNTYGLTQVNAALENLEAGREVRPLIDMHRA